MKKYKVYCQDKLLKLSGEILLAQVGQKELTGNNDGKRIVEYLKSVGLKKGQPYCAAGQYYCFKKAADKLGFDNCSIPIAKTGLANGIYNKAKADVTAKEVEYKAEANDILVWVKPNNWSGHLERIVNVIDNDLVETVGFNTSNGLKGSQREGDGVFIRTRSITKKIGSMRVRGIIGFYEV